MSSLLQGFIHPALAFGALLATVPLLIHLLNRQRHQPLSWGAMQFVLEAYKKTRRRAQLENFLLLLLRMLAVALLAFAVARPFTGKDSPLAPLTESRRDVVLLIDGSASTGYRSGVESVYETILNRAREILGELDDTRGDRVRLIHAGTYPRLLSARSPDDAVALLSTLTAPTHEPLDLTAVMAEVVNFAEEDAAGLEESAIEVRLLTDLQRRTFQPALYAPLTPETRTVVDFSPGEPGEKEPVDPPLTRALDRMAELGVVVVVEDMGAPEQMPPNLGIESVRPLGDVLGPGLASEIGVRVRNYGSSGRSAVRVALEVNGRRQPSQKVEVPARGSTEVVFPVTFRDSGYQTLEARLEGDRLAADDARAQVVTVPPAIRVLLVDGDPHAEIDLDEVGYLRAALEPPDDGLLGVMGTGSYTPFDVRVESAAVFAGSELDLSELDVIVLANVSSFSPRMVERLEARVAAGAALIFTLGDRVREPTALEAYNSRAWRADGTGLLPARLGRAVEVASRRDAYYRVADFDQEHPALEFFADERWQPFLTEVPVYAFVTSTPLSDTRVLARLDDQDKSPLLLERSYDRGRVFLLTSSIDTGWNRIAESPATLIPFSHELLRYAARGVEPERNVSVGTPMTPETETFPRAPNVLKPDGTRSPLDGEPVELAEGLWRLPQITVTDRAGLWTVETEGAPDVHFSVQLEPREGDLERIGAAELEAEHQAWKVYQKDSGADDAEGETTPDRGELWRWFAAFALGCLILETLWAAWIGSWRK